MKLNIRRQKLCFLTVSIPYLHYSNISCIYNAFGKFNIKKKVIDILKLFSFLFLLLLQFFSIILRMHFEFLLLKNHR